MIRSPAQVAVLLIENANMYAQEKDKEINRYRFMSQDLCRLSGHVVLIPDSYLQELTFELWQRGWILLRLRMDAFGMMQVELTDNWTRLGVKRVAGDAV